MDVLRFNPPAPLKPFSDMEKWQAYLAAGGPPDSLPKMAPSFTRFLPMTRRGSPIFTAYYLEIAAAPVSLDYPYKIGVWQIKPKTTREEDCRFLGVIVHHEQRSTCYLGNFMRVWDYNGGIWKFNVKDDGTLGEAYRRMRMTPPEPTYWGPDNPKTGKRRAKQVQDSF